MSQFRTSEKETYALVARLLAAIEDPSNPPEDNVRDELIDSASRWMEAIDEERAERDGSIVTPDMLARVLDLSTAHMPETKPNFGGLRYAGHAYGWIVFVSDERDDWPKWMLPIMEEASRLDCLLVNFDRDGDRIEGLPQWEW